MCSPESIIYDEKTGEYICIETGEVILDHAPDLGPEWRVFSNEDLQKERAGSPLTNKVHDKGLTTHIDTGSRLGRKLDVLNRKIRALSNKDRRLVRALELMNSVVARLNTPLTAQLKEEAGMILSKLHKKGLIKRRNVKAMVAASIILASRNLGIPLETSKVLELCQVTTQEVWNAEMKIRRDTTGIVRVRPLDPRRYLGQMAYKAKLSPEALTLASRILHVAKRDGLTSGKGPKGLAAAALYIASILLGKRVTQRDLSLTVDVSEVTIRNRYRDLVDNILIFVDL